MLNKEIFIVYVDSVIEECEDHYECVDKVFIEKYNAQKYVKSMQRKKQKGYYKHTWRIEKFEISDLVEKF
jgi:hypothetical protein